MANEAFITGELVRWARERSGLSYAEIAHSLHVDITEIRAWEEGNSYPPFGKAQDLAHLLRVPFGYLFLSKRPADNIPIPDFRTLTDRAPSEPSPEFTDVINQALLKQEWYREYSEQDGAQALGFVGRFSVNGVDRVAADIRRSLSIDAALRDSSRDWSAYLKRLSQNAQGVGVLVMRSGTVASDNFRPLEVKEFRGFALTDDLAPVVFINSRDAVAAQTFTLIHEVAHIWIGQSGVSNPDPTEVPSHRVESFCNQVAAEVLVPTDDFQAGWEMTRRSDEWPSKLARIFWVSTLVVLRKAFDLHKINRDEFFRLVKREKNKQTIRRKGGGADPYGRIITRNSQRLTVSVQSAVLQNRLLYRDAARLLEVSGATFDKLLKEADRLILVTPFWLDTNVFVEAKNRYYTFERVPKFWSFLSERLDDGSICCPKLVYDELVSYKDQLAIWVKARKGKGLCVHIDPQIQIQFGLIANHVVATYRRYQAEEFLSAADPWVIACALHVGGTVVTQESTSRKKKVRIPTVCQKFDVRCVDTFKMLEALNARF